MVVVLTSLNGLSPARLRTAAREHAASLEASDALSEALEHLDAPDPTWRRFATYMLGALDDGSPGVLDILSRCVVPDLDWRVQEALAQALDGLFAARGYAVALPVIDAWLTDERPNARRAISEGLRPWTSRRRAYFASHPDEAIRRLAALRRDPSEYVRHSAGNALRDIRRTHAALVDAETATWEMDDPHVRFTYARVLKAH